MKNKKKFVEKPKKTLKAKFVKEIRESFLLESEEKEYWLGKVDAMPEFFLKDVLKDVKKKNDLIKKYLDEAFRNNPDQDFLMKIKIKIKKIKNRIMQIEEKKAKPDAEEYLEKQFKKIK